MVRYKRLVARGPRGEAHEASALILLSGEPLFVEVFGLRSPAMANRDRWNSGDILETFGKRAYLAVDVYEGMTLKHTGSSFSGTVTDFAEGERVVLSDSTGHTEAFAAHDGAFMHNGIRVALRAPRAKRHTAPRFTPSGSIDADRSRARVARASRVWVEGQHDAELIEKIWGDDLRAAAVVVEPLHGADELACAVAEFQPGPTRRLGVLLDHLVEGSKESRIAAAVAGEDVLVLGHPYVDIWQAVKPGAIGIAAWPTVPRGRPWKDGIVSTLGVDLAPGQFWAGVLDSVESYRDVETPLVNAVEQLIDFVTVEF
jgi:hypothetical protein